MKREIVDVQKEHVTVFVYLCVWYFHFAGVLNIFAIVFGHFHVPYMHCKYKHVCESMQYMLNINVKLFSKTDLMMYAPFAYEPLIFLRTQHFHQRHLIYFSKIVLWFSFTSAQDIQFKYIALYDTKFIFTARPHAHAACAMEYFMKPMTKTSCIKET